MRDWQPKVRRLLTGQRDDLSDLSSRELGPNAGAVVVAEHVDDECLQLVVADRLKLGGVELVGSLCEARSPAANTLLLDAHGLGLLEADVEVDGEQDDLSARDESVLDGGRANESLKDRALTGQKSDGHCTTGHLRGMIRIAAEENHHHLSRDALGDALPSPSCPGS